MMRRSCLAAILSLAACTASGDPSPTKPSQENATPTPAAPSPPTPATPPTPPTPPTPEPPPTPPTPGPTPTATPTGNPTPWWCTCYARQLADAAAPEPVTACRAKKSECLALERTVANGSNGIVPRSVTHACRELHAEHPGDIMATRDAWQPSKKPGAWLSPGACLIAGEPNPDEAQPPDDIDEQLGTFKPGTPAEVIIAAVGEPKSKGRMFTEEASGDFFQTWTWQDGLSIAMSSDTRKGPQRASRLTITSPSTLKSKKGVGIGSTRADVIKHYGSKRAPESEPEDTSVFVAGSVYGGIFFKFAGTTDKPTDKVVEIFLGAGAE